MFDEKTMLWHIDGQVNLIRDRNSGKGLGGMVID